MTPIKYRCADCATEMETNTEACPTCGGHEYKLLKPFVIWAGSHEWHKPAYSSFELIWCVDEAEAGDVAWDICNEAAQSHDEEMEECDTCHGEGCEDCDGEGQYPTFEWSEHVDKNSSYWVEEYDRSIHFVVPSEFPEYKYHLHDTKVSSAQSQLERATREYDKAQAAMAKAALEVEKFTNELKKLEKLDAQG